MGKRKPLLLAIDGDNILHHAYYGNKSPANEKGIRINGVTTFFGMLNKLLRHDYYTHVMVAWDVHHVKTRRYSILAKYNIVYKNREEGLTEEQIVRRKEIHEQKRLVQQFLDLLGIYQYTSPHEDKADEADDILGSISRELGMRCHIATNDKDMLQAITNDVSVLHHKTGIIDPMGCEDTFGVEPSLVVDYLTLLGDKVDNIPGIDGCGPKTAIKLLEQYGDFKGIYKNRHMLKGQVAKSFTLLECFNNDKEYLKAIRRCLRLNYRVFEKDGVELDGEVFSLEHVQFHVNKNRKAIDKLRDKLGYNGTYMMKELDI